MAIIGTTTLVRVLSVAVTLVSASAAAQAVAVEADLSAGVSTENIRAGAVQVRLFGASASDWRFFAEATLGGADGQMSDAFSAAYPYDGRLRPMEIYVEKTYRPRNYLLGIRGGRYRTPFGIYSRSDHGYTGFTRAPLIRYGQEYALSNASMEGGVSVVAGSTRLFVETSVGVPQDEGVLRRRAGLDVTLRVQGYFKSLIVGASRLHTTRDKSLGSFATGRAVFNGIDGRWTAGGVQVRGEWLFGHPWEGVETTGGYLDLLVHRPGMGPVTAVARVERFDYTANTPARSLYLDRFTAGTRIRLLPWLTAQVNVMHQPTGFSAGRSSVLDAALTCTVRR